MVVEAKYCYHMNNMSTSPSAIPDTVRAILFTSPFCSSCRLMKQTRKVDTLKRYSSRL